MKIQEGFDKARVAGTEARKRVKEAAPGAFLKVLYLVGGIWFVWWFLTTIHDWLSPVEVKKDPASAGDTVSKAGEQVPPSDGNVEAEQVVQGGKSTAEAVEQLPALVGDTVSQIAEQFPTDDISFVLLPVGITIFFLILALTLGKKYPSAKPLFILGAVAGFLYTVFFTEAPVMIAKWDWTNSPFGQYLEEQYGVGSSMWIWLAVAAVVVIVIVRSFSTKFWSGVVEFVIVVLCIFAIIFSFQGKTFDEWFTAKAPTPEERGCEVKETSIDFRIPKGGRPVKICPDAGAFYLLPEWGHRLSYKLSPGVQSEYGYLFDTPERKLEDFFDFLPPGSHASSMPEPYLVVPKPGVHWGKSGLTELVLHIKAVK